MPSGLGFRPAAWPPPCTWLAAPRSCLRDVSSDRRTADVDALMVPEEPVLEAAREVAAERGVRSTWLNSAARPYVPPLSEALQPPEAPGLEVRTAPDEHLLAMKIIAAAEPVR